LYFLLRFFISLRSSLFCIHSCFIRCLIFSYVLKFAFMLWFIFNYNYFCLPIYFMYWGDRAHILCDLAHFDPFFFLKWRDLVFLNPALCSVLISWGVALVIDWPTCNSLHGQVSHYNAKRRPHLLSWLPF
jgi:hypothetical protein